MTSILQQINEELEMLAALFLLKKAVNRTVEGEGCGNASEVQLPSNSCKGPAGV